MLHHVNMPEDRKATLIGKNGLTKKRLEKLTKTKITIGDFVEIEGEPIEVLNAEKIVKAISRGFEPKKAFELFDENIVFEIIKVEGTPATRKRMMSRIIGANGRAKKTIEMMTGATISVYGKTVSIIGDHVSSGKAHKAVEMLLQGKKHPQVYKLLDKINES